MPIDAFDGGCVADDGTDDLYVKGAGPVFLVVGTGGADLYDIDRNDPEAGNSVKSMGANRDPSKWSLKAGVSGGKIAAAFAGSTATLEFTDSVAIRTVGR